MNALNENNPLPAPHPSLSSAIGLPATNRWWGRVAHTDVASRSRALITFLFAIGIVLVSANGALGQTDVPDADNDGLSDAAERSVYGTDPAIGDTDLDGLPDGVEIDLGTNPLSVDSDGDGATDAEEYLAGEDPLVASQAPVRVVVTQVPSTVSVGDGTVSSGSIERTDITVTPLVSEVPSESSEVLAFSDTGTGRPSLLPLYVVVAVALTVVMFRGVALLPAMHSDRPY